MSETLDYVAFVESFDVPAGCTSASAAKDKELMVQQFSSARLVCGTKWSKILDFLVLL